MKHRPSIISQVFQRKAFAKKMPTAYFYDYANNTRLLVKLSNATIVFP